MTSNIVKFKKFQAKKEAIKEDERLARFASDPINVAQYANDCARLLRSEREALESKRTSTARTLKMAAEMCDEIVDALLFMGGARRE